jgi:hypothetical protein
LAQPFNLFDGFTNLADAQERKAIITGIQMSHLIWRQRHVARPVIPKRLQYNVRIGIHIVRLTPTRIWQEEEVVAV